MNHRTNRHPVASATRLRGALAAATTALTAVFAHGAAGGHLPTSPDVALLAVAALGLGAIAGSSSIFTRPTRLFALLSVGQGACHLLLTVTAPGHPTAIPLVMLAGHAAALLAATVLIASTELTIHRCRHGAQRLRRLLVYRPRPLVAPQAVTPERTGIRRIFAGGVLRGGLTRRGPPCRLFAPIHREIPYTRRDDISMFRWFSRLGLLLAALAAAVTLTAGSAAAHAALSGSNPADGAEIDTAPEQVTLTFNEDIQSEFAAMTVVDADGAQWGRSEPQVQGRDVSVALDGLAAGTYTVAFRVTSADGHPISGTTTFTLTQSSPATAASLTPAVPADAAGQSTGQGSGGFPVWIAIAIGVIVLIGAGAVVLTRTPGSRK